MADSGRTPGGGGEGNERFFKFFSLSESLLTCRLEKVPPSVVGGLLLDPSDLCLALPLVADEGVLRQGEHAAMEPFALLLWGAGKAVFLCNPHHCMPPSLFPSPTFRFRTRKPWSSVAEEPQFRDPPCQYTPRGALVSTCVRSFLLGISLCLSPLCISHPYRVGEVHPLRRIVEELLGAPAPLGHHAGHGGGEEEERNRSASHSTFSTKVEATAGGGETSTMIRLL